MTGLICYSGEPIYQYCSMSTFEKIIENRELWLTDNAHMNDKAEGNWLETFVHYDKLSQEKIHIVLNNRAKTLPVYLCCFSSGEDLLSQWRGYADDGKGVSLGFKFDISKFSSLQCVDKLKENIYAYLFIQPVNYDADWQKKIVDDFMAYKEIDSIETASAEHSSLPKFLSHQNMLLYQNASIFCKNPAFAEEKEVRLFFAPELIGESYRIPLLLTGPHVRFASEYLATYFKLPIDGATVKLCSITTGPKNRSSESDMKFFLRDKNFPHFENIQIKPSKATYR